MLLVFLLLLLPNQLANSQKLNYIYEQFYTIPIVTHSTLDHSTHNRPNFLPLAGDNRKPEDVNEPKNTMGCSFYPFADGSAMTKDEGTVPCRLLGNYRQSQRKRSRET